MTAIHLIMGETGEYEDRRVWPVKAFRSGPAAATEVAKLKPESAMKKWANGSTYFDPDYWVEEIELVEEPRCEP